MIRKRNNTPKYDIFYQKVYITLIDVYGQDIILEYYERLIESISKKPVGVSDVIGHLCKV